MRRTRCAASGGRGVHASILLTYSGHPDIDSDLGGAFAEHLHWSMIFWINLPLAAGALALLLPEAKAEGLTAVDLTVEPHNTASRRVIEANGGVFVETFVAPAVYGAHRDGLRYRIAIG